MSWPCGAQRASASAPKPLTRHRPRSLPFGVLPERCRGDSGAAGYSNPSNRHNSVGRSPEHQAGHRIVGVRCPRLAVSTNSKAIYGAACTACNESPISSRPCFSTPASSTAHETASLPAQLVNVASLSTGDVKLVCKSHFTRKNLCQSLNTYLRTGRSEQVIAISPGLGGL